MVTREEVKLRMLKVHELTVKRRDAFIAGDLTAVTLLDKEISAVFNSRPEDFRPSMG